MPRNGFTLVELMVVILLMALIAGAVVLAAGIGGSDPTEEAGRLASRVAAARDQAIVSARPMSVWVSRSGFGFEEYRQGQWTALDAAPFQQRNWNEQLEITVDRSQGARARILFDTLGLPDSAHSVTIKGPSEDARVLVTASGDVEVR